MPKGVDITSPEQAYTTKDNIVYPSYAPTQALRQAQADEVEVQALAQNAAQARVNGSPGSTKGVATDTRGDLTTSGTKTQMEKDGLKAQT